MDNSTPVRPNVPLAALLVLLAMSSAASQTPSPSVPPVRGQSARLLTKTADVSDAFSSISSIHEFRDGRVLVVDGQEHEIRIADFTANRVTKVGRSGAGPGEYKYPALIFGLGGDSVAAYDVGLERYLVVAPDGKPGTTFALVNKAGATIVRYVAAQGSDRQGRLYVAGNASRPPRAQTVEQALQSGAFDAAPLDSLPLLRYDRRASTLDTVAWVSTVAQRWLTLGKGVLLVESNPFIAEDLWTVASDGSLAVLRSATNRVEHVPRSAGQPSSSALPFSRLAITAVDREAVEQSRMERARNQVKTSGLPVPHLPPLNDWPAAKAPFASLASRPNGEIWVERSARAGEAPRYLVVEASGRVIGDVELPADTRLVGFGASGAIYLVKKDADDLEHLIRYRLR